MIITAQSSSIQVSNQPGSMASELARANQGTFWPERRLSCKFETNREIALCCLSLTSLARCRQLIRSADTIGERSSRRYEQRPLAVALPSSGRRLEATTQLAPASGRILGSFVDGLQGGINRTPKEATLSSKVEISSGTESPLVRTEPRATRVERARRVSLHCTRVISRAAQPI